MLALTSATGKLGSAVLNALLENNLIDPAKLVICTSSDVNESKFDAFKAKGCRVRYNNFDDISSLERAFEGCDKLFLVSTPRISMDFNNAPDGQGREAHHKAAIDAARKVGVKHIYYTSLGFANPSKAGVMQAHIRTEAYLKSLKDVQYTIIREGLYNESWPLYFGYYYGLKEEKRSEVLVCGDGKISWTSIADLGFATAKVLAGKEEHWTGKTFYLSQNIAKTLKEIADVVSEAKGEKVVLKVVSKQEYEAFYVQKMGMEKAAVEWWSSSYDALEDGECAISDPTLENLFKESGRTPKPVVETIKEMLQ
ncbi:NAD(P)-binding protein [Delitschia confertaspora ATCC 74209]|uniref:NAD(P)-binding protein n=1 Tax=Delitschia confertaspora ATCC 74209 TaxID=1513339 RepID=A0A9P4JNX2_9PLEO|nr:NAD(P)-binding protein [Delitschia confertaspora ATCC 74209]